MEGFRTLCLYVIMLCMISQCSATDRIANAIEKQNALLTPGTAK